MKMVLYLLTKLITYKPDHEKKSDKSKLKEHSVKDLTRALFKTVKVIKKQGKSNKWSQCRGP